MSGGGVYAATKAGANKFMKYAATEASPTGGYSGIALSAWLCYESALSHTAWIASLKHRYSKA